MPLYHCLPLLAASSQAVASWIFGSITLVFLFIAFFFVRGKLPIWKERIVALVAALCAGLFAFFLTGYIILNVEYELSEGLKIAIQATGGLALFVLVLIWWFRATNFRAAVEPDTPLDDKLIDKLVSVSEEKGKLTDQIDYHKQQLAQALKRIKELESKGEYPQAQQAIEDLRKSSDMTKLQELLIEDRDRYKDQLIQRNREIAVVAFLRGDIDIAENAADEILKLLPDDMFALNQKGHIHSLQGRLDQAKESCDRVLELAREKQDRQTEAAALGNLGILYLTRGDLENAEQMYKKALEINQQIGRLEGQAIQYGNLGLIYEVRGNFDESEEMHKKALEIFCQLGSLEGQASTYGNLGIVYQKRGDFNKAEEIYKKSLDIFEKLGAIEGQANTYTNIGIVYRLSGDETKAEKYWQKALMLYNQIGIPHMVAKIQSLLDSLDKK